MDRRLNGLVEGVSTGRGWRVWNKRFQRLTEARDCVGNRKSYDTVALSLFRY